MDGILSFAYSFHKAPVAYYSCYLLFEDYTAIVLFYNTLVSSPAEWGPYAVLIFWNLTFNWIDILYQVSSLWKAFNLVEKEWTEIGVKLAKTISDVLFKSPVSNSWSYENSSVMNEEWGEPIEFWEGIEREFDRNLEYFGLPSFFGEEVDDKTDESPVEEFEDEAEAETIIDTEEAEEIEEETEDNDIADEVVDEQSNPAQGGL